jgi:hypothetical protein
MKAYPPLLFPALLLAGCGVREGPVPAEVRALGGTVEVQEHTPGKPVVRIDLHGAAVDDDWPRISPPSPADLPPGPPRPLR